MNKITGHLILGIDTGGTFTDFVLQSDSGLQTYKLPSTPDDPARAIMQGLAHFFGDKLPVNLEVIHGSTVATNAFLERKGANTLLITTHGFEDVLFIGRQNRPSLYDFNVTRPREIIPRTMVVGVKERMLFDGKPLKIPGKTIDQRLRKICRDRGVESIAVCFLHSYANDTHENLIQNMLAGTGLPITLSSEILPEFREYERLTTTIINSYLSPVISSYLKKLRDDLENVSLHIQQSNGSILPASDIEKRAVCTVLSGPAGGVHGSHQLANGMGLDKIITFDMGGTSTDVLLCDKLPTLTRDHRIDGYPIRIEVMDIHTVGAGGGSIARIDSGGLLKVGPESAGANPGPICYGFKGRELTVTDANLYLGRLLPDRFMGGSMKLYPENVSAAMNEFAERLDLDPVDAALGIIRITNASMAKAVRAVSLERGHDPNEFSLFSFGGASGLHCCELARELSIKKVIIPARAGILSAQGMVFADPSFDYLQTLFLTGDELYSDTLSDSMSKLVGKGLDKARAICTEEDRLDVARYLNLRYQGQSYELRIPFEKNFTELFHQSHEQNFGYSLEDKPLELISIQCIIKINRPKRDLPKAARKYKTKTIPVAEHKVHFSYGPEMVQVYERESMTPGAEIEGPALIVDDYTTVLLPGSFILRVDEMHNLVIAGWHENSSN
jgi:N-methylhydantoinase A